MSANAPTDSASVGNSEHKNSEKGNLTDADKEQHMEQYKTYLDTIARSAEERLHINELFMTINNFLATILTGLGGYTLFSGNNSLVSVLFMLSIMGYAFSRVWHLYLTNYTTVNKAKWNVVYDMEEQFHFTYHPFKEEWSGKGELKRKKANPPNYLSWLLVPSGGYYDTPKVEGALPKLFGSMYLILVLVTGTYVLRSNWSDILRFRNDILGFLKNIWHLCLEWVGILIVIFLLLLIIALRLFKESE